MATQTATREHPIVFSGEMVRTILAGRKSQMRRIVKMDDVATVVGRNTSGELDPDAPREIPEWQVERLTERCPHGQPGDRLWVRERFRIEQASVCYFTDCPTCKLSGRDGETGWKPSIFMPRWASRITLEITGVRVDRLQEMSDEDALAEGIQRSETTGRFLPNNCDYPVWAFRELWDQLNAKTATWASNPYVWIISFKRIKP